MYILHAFKTQGNPFNVFINSTLQKIPKGLFKKNKALAWVVGTVMNVALSAVVANNFSKIKKVRTCMGS